MWMNDVDYTIGRNIDTNSPNYSASERSISEVDPSSHPYSSMTDVPHQLNAGSGRNFVSDLAIGSSKNVYSCSRSAIGCFDDDTNNLPLPWRTTSKVAVIDGTLNCTSSSNSNIMKCSLAKSNSVTSAEVYAHGQDSAMLPLPWRNFYADRALPDQQAPRRTTTTLPKPSHNSSAASLRKIDDVGSSTTPHDHDSYSVHPQASCHSFRLSEAESRHSESITHQHHMIEIVQQRQGLDWYCDLSEGSILDMEQMDSRERVSLWLLSAPDSGGYDGTEDFSSREEF